jgi:hypothetical protein
MESKHKQPDNGGDGNGVTEINQENIQDFM